MTKATCKHCTEFVWARGLCAMHYQRWRRHGDPLITLQPRDRECLEPECDLPHRRYGYCEKHAKRMERYNTTMDPRERKFFALVGKRGPGECWPWLGYVAPATGYGQFGGRKYGTQLAHRIAYEYMVGPIPKGLVLDHLCHTADPQCADTKDCPHRRCVNPAHLEPVTYRENIARGRGGDSWGYMPDPVQREPVQLALAVCVNGCPKPVYKSGKCRPCYKKWLKDPTVERPRQRTPEQRFWMKVDKTGSCWLWTASINPGTGYGQFARRHGEPVDAHRFSYELAHGPIPEKHDIHHTCHTRSCVNPAHLEAVTRSENLAMRKYRRSA